jgi:hypothetical protein
MSHTTRAISAQQGGQERGDKPGSYEVLDPDRKRYSLVWVAVGNVEHGWRKQDPHIGQHLAATAVSNDVLADVPVQQAVDSFDEIMQDNMGPDFIRDTSGDSVGGGAYTQWPNQELQGDSGAQDMHLGVGA